MKHLQISEIWCSFEEAHPDRFFWVLKHELRITAQMIFQNPFRKLGYKSEYDIPAKRRITADNLTTAYRDILR